MIFKSLIEYFQCLKNLPKLVNFELWIEGKDDTGTRMEIMELPSAVHPYFVAAQYHPEYISRPLKPSPPYLGLVLAAAGKLQTYLNNAASSYSSNTTSEDGEHSGERMLS